jgi:hypothetical protein
MVFLFLANGITCERVIAAKMAADTARTDLADKKALLTAKAIVQDNKIRDVQTLFRSNKLKYQHLRLIS